MYMSKSGKNIRKWMKPQKSSTIFRKPLSGFEKKHIMQKIFHEGHLDLESPSF